MHIKVTKVPILALLLFLLLLLMVQLLIAWNDYEQKAEIIGTTQAMLIAAGKSAALLAATLIIFQFVLSARLKTLDRVFGIHRLLRLHSITGPTAAFLALFHPFLLYASKAYRGKNALTELWPELLGGTILLILATIVITTLGRRFLELPYEKWKSIHQLSFMAVVLITIHAFVLGSNLKSGWARILFITLVVIYLAIFCWVKLIKSVKLKSKLFKVTEIMRLNHDTWNLKLERDDKTFSYLPGQFAFLTLYRKNEKPNEHPFTISSTYQDKEFITFTIKESGDFTNTIGRTKAGDLARIEAPFGHFCYLNFLPFDRLIMIAGGVGITPILSCLRYMVKSNPDKPLTLIWANKTKDDIFLMNHLNELNAALPNLTIHHVLSRQPDYNGPTGHLNKNILLKFIPNPTKNTHVMLCGPIPMMKTIKKELRKSAS